MNRTSAAAALRKVAAAALGTLVLTSCTPAHAPAPQNSSTTLASPAVRKVIDTTLDLLDPTSPYPTAADPMDSPDALALAESIVAAHNLNMPFTLDADEAPLLRSYAHETILHATSVASLRSGLTTLEALKAAGVDVGISRSDLRTLVKNLSQDKVDSGIDALRELNAVRRISNLSENDGFIASKDADEYLDETLGKKCSDLRHASGAEAALLAAPLNHEIRVHCDFPASIVAPKSVLDTRSGAGVDNIVTLGSPDTDLPPQTRRAVSSQAVAELQSLPSSAGDDRIICDTDDIAALSELIALDPVQARDLSSARCVLRQIRLDGRLPGREVSPEAMNTFLAVMGLRDLPIARVDREVLDSLQASVDWNSRAITPMDRLVLALTFDASHVTRDAVASFASTAEAATPLGVVVLSAAAERLGSCDQVQRAIDSWLKATDSNPTRALASMWTGVAIADSRRCASRPLGPIIDAAKRAFAAVIASFPSSTSDQLTARWMSWTLNCAGTTTSQGHVDDRGQHSPPESVEDLVGDTLPSPLTVYMAATLNKGVATGTCADLGWPASSVAN